MGKVTIKGLKKMYLKKAISTTMFWTFKKLIKRRALIVRYERSHFTVSKFTDDECMVFFRFTSQEIKTLLHLLHIPKINRLNNRTKFTGEEGLCMLLRRLSYPNRLYDLISFFKRDIGSMSAIINFMLKYIYENYANRLHSLEQKYLTRTTLRQLADNSIDSGCPYPNIVGFIDGTCRQICRPSKNQRDLYSGYKKHHMLKYQSIVLTNGLIGRLDGPFIGRRHDAAIVHLSRVLEELESFLTNDDGTNYAVFGDLGYSNQKFVKVGFKDHSMNLIK